MAGIFHKKATGDCIMPREGLFAKVIAGGAIAKGRIALRGLEITDIPLYGVL
jgi:hypothetical protein